jgi:Cu+-exporting ATPase
MKKQINIKIGKMTCASCVQHVKKALTRVDGVDDVVVNYVTEKASVSFDPDKTTPEKMAKAVDRAGYKWLGIIDDNSGLSSVHGHAGKHGGMAHEGMAMGGMAMDSMMALSVDEHRRSFITAMFFAVPLLYIAMGPMLGLPLPAFIDYNTNAQKAVLYAFIQFLLIIPIIFAGRSFFIMGGKSLLALAPGMDSLIMLGAGAAIFYSFYNLLLIMNGSWHQVHDLYFESAGIIITLILLGEFLEEGSRGRAKEAIQKLLTLSPQTAVRLKDGREEEVALNEVVKGDILVVKAGSKVPVDGIITEGVGTLDESLITGESLPVTRKSDDNVIGGSLNTDGYFKMEARHVGSETLLSQIAKLVEAAQAEQAPIEDLANKVSAVFVPVVIAVSLIAGIAWYFVTQDLSFAVNILVAVLIVACPCALGLATPVAIMVGTGRGAQLGILIKGGETLERAGHITTIVFDKTGTITRGRPSLVSAVSVSSQVDKDELLHIAASLEQGSQHPLALALAEANTRPAYALSNFSNIVGYGVSGSVNGGSYILGAGDLMRQKNIDIGSLTAQSEQLEHEGATVIYLAQEDAILGFFGVKDTIKDDSNQAMRQLAAMNIKTVMLTGDNERTARSIAGQAGISTVFANIRPEEKSAKVKELKAGGEVVAMVGDGVNDTIALAAADVGIAVAAGSDVALEEADIVLMKNSLTDVARAVNLSKATLRNIKQNLFWAFSYNIIGIPLAAGLLKALFGGPLLNPMFAAAAMSFSSILVVGNALRLNRFSRKK